MKVDDLIVYGKSKVHSDLAKMLLADLMDVNSLELLTILDQEVPEDIINEYKYRVDELRKGRPIQYIIGNVNFCGNILEVNENVLIPRADTEILVEEVLKLTNDSNKILDLCTGSGCIAISLKKANNSLEVTASDLSQNALTIAILNAQLNDAKVSFIKSDLFDNINEKFDIIVSNPPYIRTKIINSLDVEVQNEPHLALDGGEDGLKFYRTIAENAYKYLNNGGVLALEIGYDQKEEVISLLEKAGKYSEIHCKKDLGDNDRVIVCKLK